MKQLALFLVGLLLGGGIGVVGGMGLDAPEHIHDDSHAHTAEELAAAGMAGDAETMDHGAHGQMMDISGDETLPTVGVTLVPVAGGYSLHIMTENFTFAPSAVDGPHVPGEGHAHVYADGVKILRALSPWVDLPDIAPGTEIRVELNSNSHAALAVGDAPIAATVTAPAN